MTAPLLLQPHDKDLGGGFNVRRLLPSAKRRSVGPFVFFDHFGPATETPGKAHDVRPHPHIGLATVTYLFEGEILHRDSLGSVQAIRAGEVNWMTAGRGIVHSERTPAELRASGSRIFGIQTWVALPVAAEEDPPSFSHHENLPTWEDGGITLRLILGDIPGLASPVPTLSPMVYADVAIAAMRSFAVPIGHEQRAIFVVEGDVEIGGQTIGTSELAILETGADVLVAARKHARVMLLGGAPLDAPRFVWWNFVSSRRELIQAAADDWEDGRFAQVPGEDDFIPLPKHLLLP